MRTAMQGVSSSKNGETISIRQRERRFGSGLILIACGVVFAGFARTYYLNRFFAHRVLTANLHIHGFLFSAWFALLMVQIGLVAKRRIDLHRRLGLVGALIAALMVIVGINVAIHAAKYGSPAIPPGLPVANFLVVPLFDVLVFGVLAGTGLYYRSKPEIHRRLMILATLGILTAGLARIPLEFIQARDIRTIFFMADTLALAYIAYDTVVRKCLHPACLFGGLVILMSVPLRFAIADTHAWQSFTNWLVR